MKHFVDEAENREQQLKKVKQNSTIEQTEIQKLNLIDYQKFHNELSEIINKIASLSAESRKPVVEIGYTHFQGDNSFEYYASSYKILVRKKLLIFKKEKIYNWWRRVIVEMSANRNEVIIKLNEKGTSESNITDVIKKKLKTKTNISSLNHKTALFILDYLGYKISAHNLIEYIERTP